MSSYPIPYVTTRTPHGERTVDIYSRLLGERIVYLGTPIDDGVANAVIAQLIHLESESAQTPVQLYVNSPGGAIPAMLAIYDAMQYIRPAVHTTCVGQAASTAAVLLAHFGSLDALLERIDEVAFLRFRGAAQAATRLRLHREQALLCRQLSTLALDAPIDDAAPPFARGSGDAATLAALGDAVGFGPMTRRRLQAAAGLAEAPLPPRPAGSAP